MEHTHMHEKIETWLAALPELERIERLGQEAADAWYDSLSPEHKHAFARMIERGGALYHLQNRITKERLEEKRSGREEVIFVSRHAVAERSGEVCAKRKESGR
jgi:hypothetical protein